MDETADQKLAIPAVVFGAVRYCRPALHHGPGAWFVHEINGR